LTTGKQEVRRTSRNASQCLLGELGGEGSRHFASKQFLGQASNFAVCGSVWFVRL